MIYGTIVALIIYVNPLAHTVSGKKTVALLNRSLTSGRI